MSKFIQFIFASCLGVILATVVLFAIGSAVASNALMGMKQTQKVKPNSVLKIRFDEPIPERTNNVAVNTYSFNTNDVLGLHQIIDVIETAGEDDYIKGIYLDLSQINTGRASAADLRKALSEFQEKDKFVVAYADYYTQGSYYMASVADQVFINPIGDLDFRGFSTQIPFFKDMMDKLGIKAQIFYAGNFKSATEPYRLEKMSDYNRLQVREYLDGLYTLFLQDIAASRNLSETKLRRIADQLLLRKAEDAVEYGLVDALGYDDQVRDYLKEQLGLDRSDELKMISLGNYASQKSSNTNYSIKDKIAVVYAEGEIVDGQGEAGTIGGDRYAKILRKVREDKKVKAIVLRVNSPGGSALATDIMWREIKLAKEADIPIVASMGDYAASGGYYLACVADSVFAAPSTITGSIGVFGMLPSIQKMLNDKVGITFDTVKTGQFSVGLSPFIDLSEAEKNIMQTSVEDFYEVFLSRVADGRGMSRDEAHEVAQGRVWTGVKAKELGLVDAYGDLDDAIAAAAKLAELDEYRLAEYPKIKDPIQQLIEDFTDQNQSKSMVKEELTKVFPMYEYLMQLKRMEGVQARLPFVVAGW